MILLTYIGTYFGHAICGLIFTGAWICLQIGIRTTMFFILLFCIMVNCPNKCYGKITEKQYGSFWMTVPASSFEKFLSIILLAGIIIPLIGAILYLCTDALFCAIDSRCGENVFISMQEWIKTAFNPTVVVTDEASRVFTKNYKDLFGSPWLFVDDIFGMALPFILGALVFKKGKTVKTFLCLAAFGSLTSVIMTPLVWDWFKEMNEIASSGNATIADLEALYDSSIFKNLALYDTINDTVVNLALLTAIFFRIKTLKH